MPEMHSSPLHIGASEEEIAQSLKVRAIEYWGAERAETLTGDIQETARRVWLMAQAAPPPDEVPGSYT